MRATILVVAVLLVVRSTDSTAQTSGTAARSGNNGTGSPAWSASASLFTYLVPDDDAYVQPTVTVDRNWLHLEGRFNYEDHDTASVWAGRAFSVGETVKLEITPMGAVVFGNTHGGALGYSGSIAWRTLDVSSETEYVFAAGEGESFLYTWSEFAWSPAEWFRGGIAVQRTKAYQSEFDIERGFFGAFTAGRWELSAYVFNPDADTPTVVLGVSFGF